MLLRCLVCAGTRSASSTCPRVPASLRISFGQFALAEHLGPRDVAEFDETLHAEERTIRQRDAFEEVIFLRQQLGIA